MRAVFEGRASSCGRGEQLVAVYGDSLVLAENVPLRETFVVRLEEHLRAADLPVRTLNAGVTGYGPDQSLLKFEREVRALRPAARRAGLVRSQRLRRSVAQQAVST